MVQGYIDDLLQREDYKTAAQMSPRLLKDNAGMWESWVLLFAQTRKLPLIAPFIPTERPQLREQVGNIITVTYVHASYRGFGRRRGIWALCLKEHNPRTHA